jgi:hypothetical protein
MKGKVFIDLLERRHRYSKGITNRKRKCLYHTVDVCHGGSSDLRRP